MYWEYCIFSDVRLFRCIFDLCLCVYFLVISLVICNWLFSNFFFSRIIVVIGWLLIMRFVYKGYIVNKYQLIIFVYLEYYDVFYINF